MRWPRGACPSALALAPILYVLLRPAGRLLALTALAFDVVSVAVEASLSMNLMIALFPLAGAHYLGAFGPSSCTRCRRCRSGRTLTVSASRSSSSASSRCWRAC